jgi:DNA-binding LytR/AlgR family response regulator
LKDILFVEVASKSLRVVCIDKEYISLRKENKDVIDVLCKYGFIKVHQSYYISLKNIVSFKKGEITLTNHENVSVSLKYRKNLKEKLNMFIDICG